MKKNMEIDLKKQLRKEMRQKRAQLSDEYRIFATGVIADQLLQMPEYINAKRIFSYCSIKNEVMTNELNAAILADGKILALPKVMDQHRMSFYMIDDLKQLKKGYMGIPEPDAQPECCMTPDYENDLIIVPGLAFDMRCQRLGYGGGFYDYFLQHSSVRPYACGLAYDVQLITAIPVEENDMLMDCVITDQRFIERMRQNES